MNLLAQKILAEVEHQATRHGLDITTNDGYNRAYTAARLNNPGLFATNDGPANTTTSHDGQQLNGDWPVPPEKLAKLGLPVIATREQYQLFKLASETKMTPEIAAVVVRTLIQFSQLDRALGFDEAMEHLKKHRPEIYKLALEAERIK
jgi:hypothetical protein